MKDDVRGPDQYFEKLYTWLFGGLEIDVPGYSENIINRFKEVLFKFLKLQLNLNNFFKDNQFYRLEENCHEVFKLFGLTEEKFPHQRNLTLFELKLVFCMVVLLLLDFKESQKEKFQDNPLNYILSAFRIVILYLRHITSPAYLLNGWKDYFLEGDLSYPNVYCFDNVADHKIKELKEEISVRFFDEHTGIEDAESKLKFFHSLVWLLNGNSDGKNIFLLFEEMDYIRKLFPRNIKASDSISFVKVSETTECTKKLSNTDVDGLFEGFDFSGLPDMPDKKPLSKWEEVTVEIVESIASVPPSPAASTIKSSPPPSPSFSTSSLALSDSSSFSSAPNSPPLSPTNSRASLTRQTLKNFPCFSESSNSKNGWLLFLILEILKENSELGNFQESSKSPSGNFKLFLGIGDEYDNKLSGGLSKLSLENTQ